MERPAHSYQAAFSVTAGFNSGTGYDLLLLSPASNVPVYIDRVVLTAVVSLATIYPVTLTRRSAASTGGGALIAVADSPASPAASSAIATLNTGSTGAAVGTPLDSQQWHQFGPYGY